MNVKGLLGKGDRVMHAASGKNSALKKLGRATLPFFMDDAFWRGVANVFSGSSHVAAKSVERGATNADYEALRKDWDALSGDWILVGRDMHCAVRRFEFEYAEELKVAKQEPLFNPDDESKP